MDSPSTTSLAAAACLFRSMSDPNRVAILFELSRGDQRVVDLTGHLGLAQSTVSKHLMCLKDCGLVESHSIGRASIFSLAHPELVRDLLSSAEKLLSATGDAVTLCENFSIATLSISEKQK